MVASPVQFSKVGNVASITLNRPEARNALTPQMVRDLGSAIASCRSKDIRSVLITGSGDAFCAGADVKLFVEQLEDGGPGGLSQHVQELVKELHSEVVLGLHRLEKTSCGGYQRCRRRGRFQPHACL